MTANALSLWRIVADDHILSSGCTHSFACVGPIDTNDAVFTTGHSHAAINSLFSFLLVTQLTPKQFAHGVGASKEHICDAICDALSKLANEKFEVTFAISPLAICGCDLSYVNGPTDALRHADSPLSKPYTLHVHDAVSG